MPLTQVLHPSLPRQPARASRQRSGSPLLRFQTICDSVLSEFRIGVLEPVLGSLSVRFLQFGFSQQLEGAFYDLGFDANCVLLLVTLYKWREVSVYADDEFDVQHTPK